ncbi:MAG TPA: LacI family DNA-binding transcriptional regulator [Acidimicrobiia bacterium]|nr:LacI family DNA-binding transcriptional regulator [Acidimicrobiia bacterium]
MARTLDDLAELSGVSRATVSRVINGGSVSPQTRQKVLDVLETTNYRPNLAARNLASGRSGVVGVVMHGGAPVSFWDAYFSQLLTGICDSLTSQAAGMMLWLGDRTKEETLDHILGMGMLDGVIVTADTIDDPLVDGLRASDMPVVLVGHRRADRDASYVDVDHEAAARAMAEHLITSGRTNPIHISGRPDSVSGRDRAIGFRKALQRAGIPAEDAVVAGDYSEEAGYQSVKGLIADGRRFDALFCGNDNSALGAYRALAEAGLKVPDDVAVAGFDDLKFAAELDPPLTTVRQGVGDIGRESARTLLSLLDDPESGPRRVLLPTELVVRRSTGS